MSELKRISKRTLWIYLVVIPLGLLTPPETRLGPVRSTAIVEKTVVVRGEIIRSRGPIHFFWYGGDLMSASSQFEAKFENEISYSASSIRDEIEAGEIESTPIAWKFHWHAFLMAYVVLWIFVAFFCRHWPHSKAKSGTL